MNSLAFEIPALSLVRVAGAEAIKVLNGLCTAKLVDLKAASATEAMFTDDRGRVLAHAVIALEPTSAAAWIIGLAFDAAKLAAHIDRFIFREDAQPTDATRSWSGLLLDRDDWSNWSSSVSTPADATVVGLEFEGQSGWLIRMPITGPQSRILLVPSQCKDALPAWLEHHGFKPGSAEELEQRRVRNFWPIASSEMNERTLPQELDRDHAISFTKGCYLGQETVARLDALGEVQKKLCLVEIDGSSPMAAGQSLLHEGKEVGKLNSVSPLPNVGPRLALATMRRGSIKPGSPFVVASSDESKSIVGSGSVIEHP